MFNPRKTKNPQKKRTQNSFSHKGKTGGEIGQKTLKQNSSSFTLESKLNKNQKPSQSTKKEKNKDANAMPTATNSQKVQSKTSNIRANGKQDTASSSRNFSDIFQNATKSSPNKSSSSSSLKQKENGNKRQAHVQNSSKQTMNKRSTTSIDQSTSIPPKKPKIKKESPIRGLEGFCNDHTYSSEDTFDSFRSDYSFDTMDEFLDDETDWQPSSGDDNISGFYRLFSNNNFTDTSTDDDYSLPEHVLEDLIIHQGTATKRPLLPTDNVSFDANDEVFQIIEITKHHKNQVKQPLAYRRDKLIQLSAKNHPKLINDNDIDEDDDCPQLVPIEDNFRSSEMHIEEDDCDFSFTSDECFDGFSEICTDDEESIVSDINLKYTEDFDIEEEFISKRKYQPGLISLKDKDPVTATFTCWDEKSLSSESKSKGEEDSFIWGPWNQKVVEGIIYGPKTYEDLCTAKRKDEKNGKEFEKAIEEDDDKINIDEANENADKQDEKIQEEMSVKRSNEKYINIRDIDEDFSTNESMSTDSTFLSIFYCAKNSNHVLVVLKDPFFLYGSVRLTLIAGGVEVYGYRARLGVELELFSPRGCCNLKISSAPSPSKSDYRKELDEQLYPWEDFFVHKDLQNLRQLYDPTTDAVILLRSNGERSKCMKFVAAHMNERLFPYLRPGLSSSVLPYEHLLRCHIQAVSEKALCLPPEWKELDETLAMDVGEDKKRRVLIAGGKSVGKSTLLRFLLNGQLMRQDKCLLIDLDIGQPELFIPQTVSCSTVTKPLLGPGFFLHQTPDQAYMVGHTNIQLCAHDYMRAVRTLIQYCYANNDYAQLPWLINTMGYNKGFGIEIMAVIADWLQPTDVIQLQSNRPVSNYDSLLNADFLESYPRTIYGDNEFRRARQDDNQNVGLLYQLHVINAAVVHRSRYLKEWEMSPKDLRYAMILIRLSEALQSAGIDYLTDSQPVCRSLEGLQLIDFTDEAETREELLFAIEANLVYLCHSNDDKSTTVPEPLICIGIGIVRAVDYRNEQLYLLPAMDYERLQNVNCLAIGEMPLPNSLLINQGLKVTGQVPFVFNTIDANVSRAIKQMPFRPAAFLSGKHRQQVD